MRRARLARTKFGPSCEHRGRAGTPGSPLTGISMKKLALLVLVVAFSLPGLMAQSVNSLLKAGEQTATPASADPLGRETPSGTVLGFLQAAQAGNYKAAADYLQMPAARRQSQGADLAQKLKYLMDRSFVGGLRRLSTRPDGNPEDGTPNDQTIGIFSYGDGEVPVVLVRIGDPNSGKIWLFSSETLSKVPELYDNVHAHRVEKKLPQGLVRNVFLGMPLWQWLALVAAIPLAFAIGWVVVLLLAIPRQLWLKLRNRPNLHSYSRMSTPLLLSFSALAHRIIAGYLGLPLLQRLYYYRIVGVLISIGFFWFLLRASNLTMQRLRVHAVSSGRVGTGTPRAQCATAGTSLRGRHRLSHATRPRSCRRALPDPAIGLGRSPSEPLSGGSNRNRQNLAGAGHRAEGLPRWLLGVVPESRRVVP